MHKSHYFIFLQLNPLLGATSIDKVGEVRLSGEIGEGRFVLKKTNYY